MRQSKSDSVLAMIEQLRASDPNKVALVDLENDEVWTFQDLATNSAAYGAALIGAGVMPGQTVILLMDNSAVSVLVWCALWRIGVIVCPISNNAMSVKAFASAIKQLKSSTCVFPKSMVGASTEICDILQKNKIRLLMLAEIVAKHEEACVEAARTAGNGRRLEFDCDNEDEDLAAICFTSGTSGTPKAVAHTFKSYRLNGADSINLINFNKTDRMIEYRPLAWFSAQILSLMPFLQLGITLHLAQTFSLSKFSVWIEKNAITVAPGGPAILRLLRNNGVVKGKGHLESLRLMTNSSAPLMPGELAEIHQILGVPIVNLYGCSEVGWLAGKKEASLLDETVGAPVDSVRLRIEKKECFSGLGKGVGQIVVDSVKIAKEIGFDIVERNALGAGTYYSSDYGKILDSGEIVVMGRIDDVINKGGTKISPREIELAISEHPFVNEVFALGVPDGVYGQDIACFLTLQGGGRLIPGDMAKFLDKVLPHNRIPRYMYFLDDLPKTDVGKVNRHKLRGIWEEQLMTKS